MTTSQEYPHSSTRISLNGWVVELVADHDKRLSVYIDHTDGTRVSRVNLDLSTHDKQWADRFTTQDIEES